MKKLFCILAAAVMLSGCAKSVEDEAERQMRKTVRELAKNPDTFKISDVRTVFKNDSIVVLHFKTRGQNGFGGWDAGRMEYVYYVSAREKKTKECIRDIDEKTSMIELANEFADKVKGVRSDAQKDLTDEELREKNVALKIVCDLILFGREVVRE